jgi:DNA-binding transcriptional LysR family regulator
MKLRSLEAFCAAIEEQTISGAARRMYLSQPSVSERLTELEREARTPLLKRSRRGVEPTEQGAVLYVQARKALDEIHKVDRVLRNLCEDRDKKLRFAASSTLGEHLLPELLWEFRRRRSDVAPELFVGNTREVVELVERGEMAFGIIEGEEPEGDLKCIPILDDELVVVVSSRHRWATRKVEYEDLSKEAFISREKGSGTRDVVEHSLEKMGITLNVEMELGSTSAIKEAIEAGIGFSILSRETTRLELRAGILAVAEGVVIPRRFTLIQKPSADLSAAEKTFLDYLAHSTESLSTAIRPEEG